jgi:hypothetical protein
MHNLDKIPSKNYSEQEALLYEVLKSRENFHAEIAAVRTVGELEEVLKKFAFINSEGVLSIPVFIQETEDYAETVPHDGLWVVDMSEPLQNILDALKDYSFGDLSEQQLYHALGSTSIVTSVMIRITGVELDYEDQSKIIDGELPARPAPRKIIDGEWSEVPKEIE